MSVATEPSEAEIALTQELDARANTQFSAAPAARSAAPEPMPAVDVPVTVDIYDQTYHLRGQDPAYIQGLAEIVDSKMRAVAAGGTTVDSLRVAVLAALNIADELMRMQAKYRELDGSFSRSESALRDRTANLAGLAVVCQDGVEHRESRRAARLHPARRPQGRLRPSPASGGACFRRPLRGARRMGLGRLSAGGSTCLAFAGECCCGGGTDDRKL